MVLSNPSPVPAILTITLLWSLSSRCLSRNVYINTIFAPKGNSALASKNTFISIMKNGFTNISAIFHLLVMGQNLVLTG